MCGIANNKLKTWIRPRFEILNIAAIVTYYLVSSSQGIGDYTSTKSLFYCKYLVPYNLGDFGMLSIKHLKIT